ncbi:MAG: hypothetical protein V3T72_14595, partial [Thermoanaerobaculia bacterium]
MANYGNRPAELAKYLADVSEGVDERIVAKLGACIKTWGDKREDHLEALVDFTYRASAGNLGTPKKWDQRVTAARGEVSRLFGDAVKDLMLPPPLQLFWFAALTAEDEFFETLGEVETAQLLDGLLKHQDVLSKLIGELVDKWEFLLDRDGVFQQGQQALIQRADQIVQKLIGELDSHYAKLAENAAKLQRIIKRIADKVEDTAGMQLLVEALKKLIEAIMGSELPEEANIPIEESIRRYQLWAEKLAADKERYREVVKSYKDALSSEKGSVLTLFNNTRRDVETYRDDNDLSEAKVRYDQAKGQLADWAGKRSTAGQRADAAALSGKIFKHIDDDWKVTVDLDKDFLVRFSGMFFGPLGNQTIEDLAERYLFEREVDRLNGRN